MEMTVTPLEARLLRVLKEQFLKNGTEPKTMWDPVMNNGDVMDAAGLSEPEFSEAVARQQHFGIAKAVGGTGRRGQLQIQPSIVEVVRQLDLRDHQSAPAEPELKDARFEEHEVPAEFRERGTPGGAVLTTSYLAESPNWLLNGPYLSKQHPAHLTKRIKVGRQHAYRYDELLKVRDRMTAYDDRQER